MTDWTIATAAQIAQAVRGGSVSASTVVDGCLGKIDAHDKAIGAFTFVAHERARARAAEIDAQIKRGEDVGPLAGVPFAVKNLFDVKGIATLAGSKINRDMSPASRDAVLIERLEANGAILVGALNMGEYAYDFTGENYHDGPSRNPHAREHMTGGSSGGSGAAAAAGFVPLTLGSDTNGSIRVPSSLCGLFGLKPTYGRLSRSRTFPFVASLDHLGPLARSVSDLALSYNAMTGADPSDPVCIDRIDPPVDLNTGIDGLRIAKAGGYFEEGGHAEAFNAVARICSALQVSETRVIENAGLARASAYLITMAEGSSLHLDRLKTRHADFDPDVRDRLLAGAMIPGAWVTKAQKFRSLFRAQMLALFEEIDVLIAPATPCVAPLIGQKTFVLDGKELPVRPNLGVFTQPISFIGLPVVSVPVWLEGSKLPIGVQIITAPWREDIALRVAAWLEENGHAKAPAANLEEKAA
ncbi:AtzE family amidohydrolase [Hoeflea sp. AS60]|uniref:AtzE family amidohydrolase n=1 Tax=Hoeflea sp. AS60 TaxID=3135780 RepID=UPI0031829162